MTMDRYIRVRCPRCGRLAAEAAPQSAVRVKCGRCKAVFQWPEPQRFSDRDAGELVE